MVRSSWMVQAHDWFTSWTPTHQIWKVTGNSSAFGTFQAKNKTKPKKEAKMKNVFLSFVEDKAPFQFFMRHEPLKQR